MVGTLTRWLCLVVKLPNLHMDGYGREKMTAYAEIDGGDNRVLPEPLRVLTPDQVLAVDRALASIGPFGEVRIVKVKGQVRFIQQLHSQSLLRNSA